MIALPTDPITNISLIFYNNQSSNLGTWILDEGNCNSDIDDFFSIIDNKFPAPISAGIYRLCLKNGIITEITDGITLKVIGNNLVFIY